MVKNWPLNVRLISDEGVSEVRGLHLKEGVGQEHAYLVSTKIPHEKAEELSYEQRQQWKG